MSILHISKIGSLVVLHSKNEILFTSGLATASFIFLGRDLKYCDTLDIRENLLESHGKIQIISGKTVVQLLPLLTLLQKSARCFENF